MKDKKKLIITMVACLVVVIIISITLWYFTKKKTATPAGTASGAGSGATSNTKQETAQASGFPLKSGSKGALVKTLQAKMNEWMNYYYFTLSTKPASQQLAVDGVFGPKTQEFANIIFSSSAVSESGYNWLLQQNYSGNMGTDLSSWWNF